MTWVDVCSWLILGSSVLWLSWVLVDCVIDSLARTAEQQRQILRELQDMRDEPIGPEDDPEFMETL